MQIASEQELLRNMINRLEKEIERYNQEIERYNQEIEENKNLLKFYTSILEKTYGNRDYIRSQITSINDQITSINDQVTSINDQITSTVNKIIAFQNQITQLVQQITVLTKIEQDKLQIQVNYQFEISNRKAQSAYEQFMKVAQYLQDSEEVEKLFDLLVQLKEKRTKAFIFIESSSGMGKTQMAHTLIKYNTQMPPQRKLDIYYLLASQITDTSQSVYKYYQNISNGFLQCLNKDRETLLSQNNLFEDDDDKFTASELKNKSLYIYDFIDNLGNYGTQNIVSLQLRRISQMKNCCDSMVIILDEASSLEGNQRTDENDFTLLKLMRNSLHACGILVIFCGTDNNLINIFDIARQSRTGEEFEWCYLWKKLPRISPTYLNTFNLDPIAYNIAIKSRPWFALLFAKYFNEKKNTYQQQYPDLQQVDQSFAADSLPSNLLASLLDEVFQRIFSTVVTKKFQDHDSPFIGSRIGQIMLPVATLYAQPDDIDDSERLIHRHFGILEDNCISQNQYFKVLYNASGCLIGKNYVGWKNYCRLPRTEEDLLLHLVFLGGHSYVSIFGDAFDIQSTDAIPYMSEFLNLDSKYKKFMSLSSMDNPYQKTDDETALEGFSLAAFILSSRKCGLPGITLQQFLQYALFHMSTTQGQTQIPNIIWDEKLDAFKTTLVPFMLSPQFYNDIADENLYLCTKIADFELVPTIRTQNKDRIDFRTAFYGARKIIKIECNYRSQKNIDKAEFEKVMVNLLSGEKAWLNILVTTKIGKVFEQSQNEFKALVEKNNAQDVSIRFMRQNDLGQYQMIQQYPMLDTGRKIERLFLVLVVQDYNAK